MTRRGAWATEGSMGRVGGNCSGRPRETDTEDMTGATIEYQMFDDCFEKGIFDMYFPALPVRGERMQGQR